jgi:anti-sigma28 factor (negative regulator of flagellin synthesis)
MKARTQGTDASILLAHVYSGRMEQIETHAHSIAKVKAQLLAYSDAVARIAWIKMLKAQIDAGTYIVNSRSIAQKIQFSPAMGTMLEFETNNMWLATWEDEP